MVSVTIDNINIRIFSQSTIIEACNFAGIAVPRFCFHKKLSIAGNFRMFIVEVKKFLKPVSSCALKVMEGMRIFTNPSLFFFNLDDQLVDLMVMSAVYTSTFIILLIIVLFVYSVWTEILHEFNEIKNLHSSQLVICIIKAFSAFLQRIHKLLTENKNLSIFHSICIVLYTLLDWCMLHEIIVRFLYKMDYKSLEFCRSRAIPFYFPDFKNDGRLIFLYYSFSVYYISLYLFFIITGWFDLYLFPDEENHIYSFCMKFIFGYDYYIRLGVSFNIIGFYMIFFVVISICLMLIKKSKHARL